MRRETLRVELVTPCFLGGAGQGAEWRSASIRGELRWWFRVVAGAVWSLEKMRSVEARIFGSTDRQALLQIRTIGGPSPEIGDSPFQGGLDAREIAEHWNDKTKETQDRLRVEIDGKEIRSKPLQYLAFGPFEKGKLKRSYLPVKSPAEIQLQWRAEVDTGGLFEDALWAWLNLGGLGAKSRKGYGSLRLLGRKISPGSEEGGEGPETRKDFEAQAAKLLSRYRTGDSDPEWTCFSPESQIFVATQDFTNWQRAMEYLGSWLIGFRRRYGYPKDSRVVNGLALKDRDYVWASPKAKPPLLGAEIPDRAGFGLPLPFVKKINNQPYGKNVTWGYGGKGDEKEPRRASPLLLHVAYLDGKCVPVLTYLPARFLPTGGKLKFQGDPRLFPPTSRQLGIISEFLGDLQTKGLIREVKP